MTATAIIPARGGSKRIPRKNIRLFKGKPMITWAIEAAINSRLFQSVIVSTDDSEIAEVAMKSGAQVPFVRPTSLSNDHATTLEVMTHAVNWLQENRQPSEFICCIYATAPFLNPKDLESGLLALKERSVDFAYSVTEFDYPPHRALAQKPNGLVSLENPEFSVTRSQDLPRVLHDAGQFYWARANTWLAKKDILSSVGFGIELPRSQAQDIDSEEDWKIAEALFTAHS